MNKTYKNCVAVRRPYSTLIVAIFLYACFFLFLLACRCDMEVEDITVGYTICGFIFLLATRYLLAFFNWGIFTQEDRIWVQTWRKKKSEYMVYDIIRITTYLDAREGSRLNLHFKDGKVVSIVEAYRGYDKFRRYLFNKRRCIEYLD